MKKTYVHYFFSCGKTVVRPQWLATYAVERLEEKYGKLLWAEEITKVED